MSEIIPAVSVVMPVFNEAPWLPDAVRSIQEQTLKNWELIIIDDGSTDGSVELSLDYSKNDSRIRVITKNHSGLVDTLNAGLHEARSLFMARMDADDISLPDRLEKQLEFLRENGSCTVCSCLVKSFPIDTVGEGMMVYEKWLNSLITDIEIKRDFFIESPVAHPSVMFRTEEVISAGGYLDHGWPEDYDLWMRLIARGAGFAKIPEVLLLWRDTPERLSRTSNVYSPAAFRSLKLHYLLAGCLKNRNKVTIWGAGREGRLWCRELQIAGRRVRRFIDIDPEKTGRHIGEIPIFPPDILAKRLPEDFILACVASRGARSRIRKKLLDYGYLEIEDFLLVS